MSDEQNPEDREELTDVPAFEPAPTDALEIEAEEEAAEEAGSIGGVSGEEGLPEAERPLAEAGEGEAEGFEQSEAALIEAASHGDPAGQPARRPVHARGGGGRGPLHLRRGGPGQRQRG